MGFQSLVNGHTLDDFFQLLGVKLTDAKKLFSIFDDDESGDLSLVEFVGGCLSLGSAARAMDLAAVRYGQKVQSTEFKLGMARLYDGLVHVDNLLRHTIAGVNGITSNPIKFILDSSCSVPHP